MIATFLGLPVIVSPNMPPHIDAVMTLDGRRVIVTANADAMFVRVYAKAARAAALRNLARLVAEAEARLFGIEAE